MQTALRLQPVTRRQTKRLVIVEAQTIFRELLARELGGDGGFHVSQAGCGLDALAFCRRLDPDLVILNPSLPDVSGLDVLRELLAFKPELPVLVVSNDARTLSVQQAAQQGARGFVTKNTCLNEFWVAVRQLASGGHYFCPKSSPLLASTLWTQPTTPPLTHRQREVVQLLAQGLSSKQIARALGISPKTVANHRQQIRQRLKLNDVISITRYAIEHGMVDPWT